MFAKPAGMRLLPARGAPLAFLCVENLRMERHAGRKKNRKGSEVGKQPNR
jgi:hypothetical protein